MCILRVASKNRSFKPFSTRTKVPVYSVRDKGEAISAGAKTRCKIYSISFDVSKKEWGDLPGQIKDAVRFLTRYGSKIRKLTKENWVTDAYLDFPVYSRASKGIVAQSDTFPLDLVTLCSKAGVAICISMYHDGV